MEIYTWNAWIDTLFCIAMQLSMGQHDTVEVAHHMMDYFEVLGALSDGTACSALPLN